MHHSSPVRARGRLALASCLIFAATGLAGCGSSDQGVVQAPAKERPGMMERMGGGIGPKSAKAKKSGVPIVDEDLKRRGGEG